MSLIETCFCLLLYVILLSSILASPGFGPTCFWKKINTFLKPSETIKLCLRTGIRRRWLFIRNRLDGCLLFTQSLLAIEKKYLKFWRCKSVQNWSLVNAKFTYILRPRIFELINIQYWRLEILCIFMTKILA